MRSAQRSTRIFAALGRAAAVAPTLAVLGLLALAALRLAKAIGDGRGLRGARRRGRGRAGRPPTSAPASCTGCATASATSARPLVGPLVIAPFREHHVDPQILARKDFFDAASSNAWLALALVGALALARSTARRIGRARSSLGSFVVSTLAAAVFLTNTFHQWAHQAAPPRAARWLQRAAPRDPAGASRAPPRAGDARLLRHHRLVQCDARPLGASSRGWSARSRGCASTPRRSRRHGMTVALRSQRPPRRSPSRSLGSRCRPPAPPIP